MRLRSHLEHMNPTSKTKSGLMSRAHIPRTRAFFNAANDHNPVSHRPKRGLVLMAGLLALAVPKIFRLKWRVDWLAARGL